MYHLTARDRYDDNGSTLSCTTLGEALFFATEVARIPDKFGNERRVEINGVPIFGSYFDDYEDYELYGIINDVDTIYPDDEFEYDKIDIISMSYDN